MLVNTFAYGLCVRCDKACPVNVLVVGSHTCRFFSFLFLALHLMEKVICLYFLLWKSPVVSCRRGSWIVRDRAYSLLAMIRDCCKLHVCFRELRASRQNVKRTKRNVINLTRSARKAFRSIVWIFLYIFHVAGKSRARQRLYKYSWVWLAVFILVA